MSDINTAILIIISALLVALLYRMNEDNDHQTQPSQTIVNVPSSTVYPYDYINYINPWYYGGALLYPGYYRGWNHSNWRDDWHGRTDPVRPKQPIRTSQSPPRNRPSRQQTTPRPHGRR